MRKGEEREKAQHRLLLIILRTQVEILIPTGFLLVFMSNLRTLRSLFYL